MWTKHSVRSHSTQSAVYWRIRKLQLKSMRSILFNLTQIFFCSIASFILMNFNLLFIHDFRWGQQNKHTYIYIYALIHRIQYDPFDIQFPSVAYAVYGRDGNIS